MFHGFKLIKVIPTESHDALTLIQELDHDLLQRYPGDSVHTLDLSKISADNGVFLVGYLAGQPVACGAVTTLSLDMGEIKRVYVRPAFRGQGLSKLVMQRLEEESRRLGLRRLRLETGARQPESLGLYRSLGFYDIPKFGEYVDDPHSLCMEKILA